MKIYAPRSFFVAIFSIAAASVLFAASMNSDVVSAQNGVEVTVPDGRSWILTKDSLASKKVKLYVKGVFYLSKDVVAEITPPTDLAPSTSKLFGGKRSDEIEIDIPNGAEYDFYFREGAKIRVESNNGPVTFLSVAAQ